jgi:hypothetical protein
MRNPPVLISVVGFFAALAGFSLLFTGLQLLGFDWFGLLGDLPRYEQSGLWGWFAVIAGVAWLAAALGLWALQPWAWVFSMVVAGFSLFEAFLWFLEAPGSGIGFATGLLPLVMLFYLNSQQVKQAFGLLPTTNVVMDEE